MARNGQDRGSIRLKEWVPKKHLKEGESILLIGKTKSGKTTAAVAIAYELRHVEMAVAYSGTMDSQTTFDALLPSTFCYKGWQPDRVMMQLEQLGRLNGERKRKGLPPYECTMYLDDMGFDKKFTNSSAFRELMMNGRHSGVRPIVCMQYAVSLLPELRGNFDWIGLFRDILPSTRTRLKQHYAEMLGDNFDEIFDAVTQKFGCLMIHNSGSSTNLEEIFYWYRAPLRHPDKNPKLPPWRIGGERMWGYHVKEFDPTRANQTTTASTSRNGKNRSRGIKLLADKKNK